MSRAVAKVDQTRDITEAPRPVVPREIARLIADPYTLDGMPDPGAWTLPAVIPDRKLLEGVRDSLKAHMAGSSPEWIAACLVRLAALTHIEGHKDLTPRAKELFWKAKAEEYIRLLGKFPPDIWARCTDQAVLKDRFFPQPADLHALMEVEMGRRVSALWRIEQMLKAPEKTSDQPKEALPDRLRGIIAAWQKLPVESMTRGILAKGAINAEIELAEIEGREIEAWAR